jgi:histidine phosphotransferase ChpT
MPELGETLRLVQVVCARLCHDLAGLVGTVGNAVDMVAEDADRDDEILAFAASAARALTQRLQLLRAAWGPDAEVSLPALVELVTPHLAARRIGLDARSLPKAALFSPPIARVLLNILLLACDCLPRGGTIVLAGQPADLLIRIEGPDATWPPGLTDCVRDESAAWAALTGARSIQLPLTALMAHSQNLRLSPVFGNGPGIEAVRLAGRPAA